MSLIARLSLRFWFVAPLIALGFVLWIHSSRVQRVELVSAPATTVAIDPKSPTGYAGGVRMLLVPGHNNESYQWIAQTQQMIARGEWRLRQVNYDNAPTGRPVHSSSLYRWWLGVTGWSIHLFSDAPIGLAVEKAALWADPVLHLILLFVAGGLTWWRFGKLPALLLSLAIAALFPLAAGFVPGAPDARNLAHAVLFVSVLTLLAGVLALESSWIMARRWFIAAGVLGGVALWADVATATVLFSIGLGGLGAAWINRKNTSVTLPWRAWAIVGAAATLASYLLEYAPAHLAVKAFRLTSIHPLYALAWLGGGECLARSAGFFRGEKTGRGNMIAFGGAALAALTLPAVMWFREDKAFLDPGVFANRITLLDDALGADNFAKWLVQSGLTIELVAACLPLLLIPLAIWLLCRRDTAVLRRTALAILVVPVLVAFGFAWAELSWWNPLHYLLLAVVVLATSGSTITERQAAGWLAGTIVALLPGFIALVPNGAGSPPTLSVAESQSLAERDFAHWLARRQGEEGAVVLAPPNLTVSLFFHGGLQGLGSPYRENEDGFRASVRLAGAVHADEAHALARQRGVTHIVIPSWDSFLDEYARLGGAEIEKTFLGLLHSWLPPRWLRPVAYYLPNTDTFANEHIFVFEQTEIQDNATSLSRLAEYFIDMGQIPFAGQVAQALAHEYSGDLGAQVAKARTDIVRRDRAAFTKSIEAIAAALAEGADDLLPWDRRVSLCLVLAAGNRLPIAKEQAERCLYEMSQAELRTLSAPTLFQFLLLCKTLELQIEDPDLREFAHSLVPAEVRDQL